MHQTTVKKTFLVLGGNVNLALRVHLCRQEQHNALLESSSSDDDEEVSTSLLEQKMTNGELKTLLRIVEPFVSPEDIYHPTLCISLDSFNLNIASPNSTRMTRLNFRKSDITGLKDALSRIDWLFECDNLVSQVSRFYTIFDDLIRSFVPLCNRRSYLGPPWFTRELRRVRNLRNKMYRRFLLSGNSIDFRNYSVTKSKFVSLNKDCYERYLIRMRYTLNSDPKSFYNFVNSKRRTRTFPSFMRYKGTVSDNEKVIADFFADYFKESYVDNWNVGSEYTYFIPSVPIFSHITLTESEVLDGLRSSSINYCPGPDGIPSSILKECADLLYIPLTHLFNLFLRAGNFPDMWNVMLFPCSRKRRQLDVIYTDFSKAFDMVNHRLLLYKFDVLGFPPILLRWIDSYLHGRTQRDAFKDCLSTLIHVTSGVPQGSHLGPVLFNLYLNDLPSVIVSSRILMCADDVKLFLSLDSARDTSLLQDDIDRLVEWCASNCMLVNRLSTALGTVLRFNDLGVLLDSRLDFGPHIEECVNKAMGVLGFIKRWSKEFVDPYLTKRLFTTLVRPILEYACVVWSPSYRYYIDRVESVQKQFLIFALRGLGWNNLYDLPPYSRRLLLIDLLSLERRRNYNSVYTLFSLSESIPAIKETILKLDNNVAEPRVVAF
ncbi:uncharacterized protein LOC142239703 [Haematobia irritans]|uniref:uncharacterized protein LOC142239703 n=1 Tax=Haematobia irritans TaxID=7368 RepID=UPI003F4FAE44